MADSLSEGVNLSRERIENGISTRYDGNGKDMLISEHRQRLCFTIGLPASGKSTWAKEYVKQHSNTIRISRDDLRNMRGIYWLPKQENMITDMEISSTAIALASGFDVIVDATNLDEQRRKNYISKVKVELNSRGWFSRMNFRVGTQVFNTTVEECIKRDNERTEGKVGKKVILQMANKYGLESKYPEYKMRVGLPTVIICDLDGTLAINRTRRGFYDWSRVGEDDIDMIIKGILDAQNTVGIRTIIMSGRDGVCRPETTEWLNVHGVQYESILMRQEKDQRKDSVVKKELFDLYIKDTYNVLFALDDRDQVVDMWRKELGIKTLQVNYGNF